VDVADEVPVLWRLLDHDAASVAQHAKRETALIAGSMTRQSEVHDWYRARRSRTGDSGIAPIRFEAGADQCLRLGLAPFSVKVVNCRKM